MTRYAYIGLLLVAIASVVYVLISATGDGTPKAPFERYAQGEMEGLTFGSRGDAAPTDTFFGPGGEAVTLQAFEGKTILLNFWATWCGPCEKEMPALGALQDARGGENFQVVAISVDSLEDRDYAKRRLGELGAANIDFYFAPPENYEVVYGAGARGFPTTIIYGPDGIEIARLEGDADWASIEAVNFIDAVVAAGAD